METQLMLNSQFGNVLVSFFYSFIYYQVLFFPSTEKLLLLFAHIIIICAQYYVIGSFDVIRLLTMKKNEYKKRKNKSNYCECDFFLYWF